MPENVFSELDIEFLSGLGLEYDKDNGIIDRNTGNIMPYTGEVFAEGMLALSYSRWIEESEELYNKIPELRLWGDYYKQFKLGDIRVAKCVNGDKMLVEYNETTYVFSSIGQDGVFITDIIAKHEIPPFGSIISEVKLSRKVCPNEFLIVKVETRRSNHDSAVNTINCSLDNKICYTAPSAGAIEMSETNFLSCMNSAILSSIKSPVWRSNRDIYPAFDIFNKINCIYKSFFAASLKMVATHSEEICEQLRRREAAIEATCRSEISALLRRSAADKEELYKMANMLITINGQYGEDKQPKNIPVD